MTKLLQLSVITIQCVIIDAWNYSDVCNKMPANTVKYLNKIKLNSMKQHDKRIILSQMQCNKIEQVKLKRAFPAILNSEESSTAENKNSEKSRILLEFTKVCDLHKFTSIVQKIAVSFASIIKSNSHRVVLADTQYHHRMMTQTGLPLLMTSSESLNYIRNTR